PLRGYALALADVERHGGRPSEISLDTAREAGVITASAEHAAEKPKRGLLARPKTVMAAAAMPKPAKPTFVTASLGSSLIDSRGYWHGAVQSGPDLPAAKTIPDPFATASADASATGGSALAYAAETDAAERAQPIRPMGTRIPRAPREASVMPARGNTTVVAKPPLAAAL